jgi:O-antigen/teichoic acid export membrane protein
MPSGRGRSATVPTPSANDMSLGSPQPDDAPARPGAVAPARSEARRIFRNTGILAVSGLIVRGMGMLMVFLLARYLKAEGYGAYQRAESFTLMFSILASLGLDMIVTREVARRSPDTPEYLSGALVLKLMLAPLCFAIILGIAHLRGYQDNFLFGIWCYCFVLFMTALGQTADAVFQGMDNMQNIAIGNLVNQVVFVGLAIGSMALHRYAPGVGLRWILVALVVAAAVRLAVSFWLLARLKPHWRRPSPATLRFLLLQSIPIAVATSFVVVYQQLDAVLLGEIKGNAQVGLYRASGKFLLFFTVLRESFLVAIYPAFAAAAHDRERMEGLVTRSIRYQLVGALYFVICFVMLPRVAPRLLGDDFRQTASILPIMGWVLLPQTISITMGRVLVASGNQNRIAFATALALAVNAGLNLALIPRLGPLGAATAAAISELAVAGVNVWFVQRYVGRTHIVQAVTRPVLAAVLAGAALHGVLHFVPTLGFSMTLPLAGVLYLAGLLALGTFSPRELNLFWSALREGLDRLRGSDEATARTYNPR